MRASPASTEAPRHAARTAGPFLLAVLIAGCGSEEEAAPAPVEAEVVQDSVEEAAWSRDGSRLAVAWSRRGRVRVYGLFGPHDGMPPEPSTGIPLTEGGRSPSWSPDGLWLAYASGGDVWRVRPDGTGAEALVADSAAEGEPAYAPDGGRLAFVTDRGGDGPRIWIADANGGDTRPLGVDDGGGHAGPAWSPDGSRLAFTVGEGTGSTVWTSGANGTGARALWPGRAPAWSPDGSELWFHRSDSIFVAPPEPDAPARFVTEGRVPRPSPDGRWLALVRGNQAEAALYLLDLVSLEATRITP